MIKCVLTCLVVLGLVMVACTPGIYPLLGRPLADPVAALPQVDSFKMEGAVAVSWSADINADSFVLYRRADQAGAAAVIVYYGSALDYQDKDGAAEERYLYSLAKVRGKREFPGAGEVLGVFGSVVWDFYEPNNVKEAAALLEADISANSWYYKDKSGNVVQDEDWYYVSIPPRRAAHLKVCQNGINAGNTFFYFAREGEIRFQAESNADIALNNYAYNTQKVYFKLTPVPGAFLNDINQAGGAVVGYKISLDTIANL